MSLRSPWVAQPDSVPLSALTSTYRPVLIKSTPLGRLPKGPGGLSQLQDHSLAQHKSEWDLDLLPCRPAISVAIHSPAPVPGQ